MLSNVPEGRANRRSALADAALYLVTDARRHIDPGFGELERFADAALSAGVDIIQLRDKGSAGERELGEMEAAEELAALAVLRGVADRHGKLLAVNDRADIAIAARADVLHTGQKDLPVAVARELISDGAANFLWTAHWLAVAALLVVVLCGAGLARNFLLGDFFTLGSYRWVAAMCWTLIFYMFVPGFVGMLGGNMVLRDLGLHWLTIPAIDTNDFIVMYVLVMTLSLVGVAIRRASVLERDTEGLV